MMLEIGKEKVVWVGNAPISCKPPPPPPRETTGDLTASLCPGWGIWPQGGLQGWGTLTDASLHCDLRVYRVGLFDHFVCPRVGIWDTFDPHLGQIPTISWMGGGGTLGHAIDRCINAKNACKLQSTNQSGVNRISWVVFFILNNLPPNLFFYFQKFGSNSFF